MKKENLNNEINTEENLPEGNENIKKKRFPLWARIVSIVLAVVLAIGLLAVIFVNVQLSKINRYDPDSIDTVSPEDEYFETDEYVDGVQIADPDDIDWGEDVNVITKKGIVNVLLIGQDTRQEGIKGRSDSMMLLTINKKTKELKVTSIMRDLYVQIPGYSDNRINAAYAFGGYELLRSTIEKNFGVSVDFFAEVDFFAFKKVVDILDGIYVDLNAEEAAALKSWGHRTVEGRNRLDGAAALSYCTMRYVGNSDYERTARQRRALSSIYARLRENATLPKILELVDEILPLITTDMTNGQIINLATSLYSLNIATIEQHRVPYDGAYTPMYINGMAVLVPDIQKNRDYLREIIYGDTK